jgi:hypothetical protein
MQLKFTLTLGAVLALILTQPVAAKLYKWVDETGKTHYTDTIPPKHADKSRSELNDKGVEVDRVDRAKTPEEMAQEKELERLRQEREKLIAKQKTEDDVLLRTFRSEDDIIMAQDGKLAAIDVMIEITKSNIRQYKAQLADMQGRAATLERMGKKPAARLVQDIANTRRQLKEGYATIIERENGKELIKQKTASDLKRFRELKNLETSRAPEIKSRAKASQLDNVVSCADKDTCDAYWEKARVYALQHATTRVELASESVVLTANPVKNSDISVTLSRIAKEDGAGEHLFLDLQCKDSKEGRKFCEGEKIKSIRSGFRTLLEGKAEKPLAGK